MATQNVALIAGTTGLVGEALVSLLLKPGTLGGPWKVYGLARSSRPDWIAPVVVYVQCDLRDRETTLAKLSPLTDVTHLFWLTYTGKFDEYDDCIGNENMMRNALDALLPNAKGLKHIALQTGGKQYLGSLEAMLQGSLFNPLPNPFTEDLPRLPFNNFYHNLEDVVLETAKQKQGKLTWAVHRPGAIFGVAAGTGMNLIGTLAVYATICKHEGLPLAYPGQQTMWEALSDASSGDLIAEQQVWAATDPRGQNQAFNSVNGDVFKWKYLWKALSEKLEMDFVPFNGEPTPLSVSMNGKEAVWDKIVQENSLVPTQLDAVGHWSFADAYFSSPAGNLLLSTNKSKEHGFLSFRNTEKSFFDIVDRMRERKIIPY